MSGWNPQGKSPRPLRNGPRDATFDLRPAPGRMTGALTQEDNVLSQTTVAVPVRTAAGVAMTADPKAVSSEVLLERILSSLDDDKAEEVVPIPLKGKSEMADYMVICSGRSSRQVVSISDNLSERLKADFGVVSKIEGKDQGDWVLIDAGDIIVHVFRPEVREFYQLEKMWLSQPGARAVQA
jgi:ribosome-associated protein